MPVRPLRRSRSAVVLAYHAIADLPAGARLRPYSVPPAEFIAQLDALERAGYRFIDLDALLAALDGARSLPPKAALVTFDDCYADLGSIAAPALAARGIPAVAFAVAGRLGAINDWDADEAEPHLRLLDVDGLRELSRLGIEVGGHSVTHARLTELSPEQLVGEVVGCCDRIEAAGLPRPRAFAYPYGAQGADVVDAVRDAGLRAAFITESGLVTPSSDRFLLPRMELRRGDTGARFHLRLRAVHAPPFMRRALARVAVRRQAPISSPDAEPSSTPPSRGRS